MPINVRPAAVPVHATLSQAAAPRQLRLPLMARAERSNGLTSPNPAAIEPLRLFLAAKSAATAKDVALATGARSSRIHNEDEGRVVHSTGTAVARFLTLPARDQRRFINKLCEIAGLPPYAAGERSLDDSAVRR